MDNNDASDGPDPNRARMEPLPFLIVAAKQMLRVQNEIQDAQDILNDVLSVSPNYGEFVRLHQATNQFNPGDLPPEFHEELLQLEAAGLIKINRTPAMHIKSAIDSFVVTSDFLRRASGRLAAMTGELLVAHAALNGGEHKSANSRQIAEAAIRKAGKNAQGGEK